MYYCLIASLEQYSLSSEPKSIDFEALRSEILEELTSKDMEAVQLLYAYYDVVNLLNRLSGRDTLHNSLGNLSEEEITAEIEGGDPEDDEPFVSKLPVSVAYALSVIKGRVEVEDDEAASAVTEEQIEKLLLSNFYVQCEKSHSKYLRAWGEADRKIRQACAGESLMGGDAREDFKEEGWWADLQGVIGTSDFVEREHKMDALRWNFALELLEPGGIDSQMHQFDLAAVMNYLIELNILQRWGTLSKEIGRERFEKMVNSFTEKGVVKAQD
ncbi:MAG: DUF2764 family protein [Rikenellaceae bacterium]